MSRDDEPDLGACCICGGMRLVRSAVMLSVKNAVPGHGWGCVVCGLPFDGASAVLCDDCMGQYAIGAAPLRFICRGYPGEDGRAPAAEFTEPHEHDMSVDHDA